MSLLNSPYKAKVRELKQQLEEARATNRAMLEMLDAAHLTIEKVREYCSHQGMWEDRTKASILAILDGKKVGDE